MAQLTGEGLVIDRQPEILDNLKENAQQDIDSNISIRDDELLGQSYNILSLELAKAQELLEAVNNNFNVLKAEGNNLDDLGTLLGIPRQGNSKSATTTQYFTDKNGTVIPLGTLLRNPITLDQFATTSQITVSNLECISIKYSVDQVLNSTTYQVNINDTAYQYTSDVTATELEIITGLKASIDVTAPTLFTATLDTINNYLIISSVDTTNIKVTFEAYLSTVEVTVKGSVEAEEFGAISAPSNSVTEMITSTSVVTTNPTAYTLGRVKESDEEYRERLLTTRSTAGKATVEAIQDDTSVVDGVTVSNVIENVLTITDPSGRPEHSFETIVQGGTDADVAKAIWTAKPAGIESHGNTTVVTEDKYGNPQSVKLTRPTTVNLAFEVDYTPHTETDFPSNGESLIVASIENNTNDNTIGEDVIPISYFGDIIGQVGYLENLVVKVQQITNQGDTPNPANWQTTKLAVSDAEYARTVTSDITVQEV